VRSVFQRAEEALHGQVVRDLVDPVHAAGDALFVQQIQEVRDMTADWLPRYNSHRPHEALGRIPPVEYRVKAASL
jgi:transposase InsO family protein